MRANSTIVERCDAQIATRRLDLRYRKADTGLSVLEERLIRIVEARRAAGIGSA